MGTDRDTAIGGSDGRFPSTRMSVVESLRSDDDDTRRIARERLVTLYWKPLYKYVRIRWRRSNEDAKDLIQDFFAVAIERDTLASFDPAKASFRTFLRVLLDRQASNEGKSRRRLKRGGDLVALDFDSAEAELARVSTSVPDPDEMLRREWIRSLFALSVDRLRDELAGSGRAQQFRVFQAFDLDDGEVRPRYLDIAAELGITETTVTNNLAAARRRFRTIVLDALREMTASEAEFRAEARAVLGVEP